jgi:hypothetical protein
MEAGEELPAFNHHAFHRTTTDDDGEFGEIFRTNKRSKAN